MPKIDPWRFPIDKFPGFAELVSSYADLLDQMIDHTVSLIDVFDPDAPTPVSFSASHATRQCINYSLGISLLLRNCAGESSFPQVRAVVECACGLAYMLKEDTEYRASAYAYSLRRNSHDDYIRMCPDTSEGKKLRHLIESDGHLDILQGGNLSAEMELASFDKFIIDNGFEKIHEDWESVRLQRKDYTPRWHELNNGPKGAPGLAGATAGKSLYEIYYRRINLDVHGSTPRSVIEGGIVPPLSPMYSDEAVRITGNSLMFVITQILRYAPSTCEIANQFKENELSNALETNKIINKTRIRWD